MNNILQKTKHSIVGLVWTFFIPTLLFAQTEINGFYVGHSLSDQIPDMVKSLADDHTDFVFDWAYQSIPGAPLRWQWQRKDAMDYDANPPYYYGFYDADGGLPTGDYDILILTESVPRYMDIIDETYQYTDSFFVYAKRYNPDTKIYIYEDWHCLLSGMPSQCDYDVDSNPWRQRLEDDLPMWESVVDYLNKKHNPNNPVCLIPVGQGLAKVYDAIYAGMMPGLSSIDDLFTDRIHLNDIGKYFVACVHFATIYETSPVGLTHQLKYWWGGDFDPPSPELAFTFQEIAWDIATNYRSSCIDDQQTSTIEISQSVIFYPNPVFDYLHISSEEFKNCFIKVYDLSNRLVAHSNTKNIDLGHLSAGLYIIKVIGKNNHLVATEKIIVLD